MHSNLFRRVSLGTAFAALGVGLTSLSAHPAAAQTTIYNNTTTASGSGFENGGATAASPNTTIVADDITPAAGFDGQAVTGFTFSIVNFGAAAVTSSPTAYFYSVNPDPMLSTPATLLASVTFSPITQAAGSAGLYTFTNPTGIFNVPTVDPGSGISFYAGLSFSGAPAAQLNTLGQLLYDPPTVGSSQDVFFQSSAPAPTTPDNNPVGGLFFFGGPPANPVANFAWSFSVTPPPSVPEASTTVSLGLMLALGMGGLVIASRRKKASARA